MRFPAERLRVVGRAIESTAWGGQDLYICPAEDLVVLVTAGADDVAGERDQGMAGETVWKRHVPPVIRDP